MPTPLRVLVGALGPGVLPTRADEEPPAGTVLLDLGPGHPSGTGLVELRLWVAGDDSEEGDGPGPVVTAVQVVVGALHRGVEKLFEVRDYRQVLALADRHDWQAPFAAEVTVALACEQLLGLEVPPRAVWLRTLLAEHTRLLSHLGFLAWVPHRLGVASPTARVRELLRDRLQTLTGNRVHPMVNRVGGVAADPEEAWLDDELRVVAAVREVAARLAGWLEDPALRTSLTGTAVLTRALAAQFGVTGPAARASGVAADLRVQRPYLAYAELAGLVVPTPWVAGDAYARLATLVHELSVSADLVEACVARLRTVVGDMAVRLAKPRLPEGEVYVATEAPLGVAGVFLVSRGERTPWRLKLRTPSFNHVAALEALLPGVRVEDLEASLASVGYVVGDLDK